MTHSLAEPKLEDDTAVPQQRIAEQQRETGEPSAESGRSAQARTASQGPAALAGLVFGPRGQQRAVEVGRDQPRPLLRVTHSATLSVCEATAGYPVLRALDAG
jgi:hypothetical protein